MEEETFQYFAEKNFQVGDFISMSIQLLYYMANVESTGYPCLNDNIDSIVAWWYMHSLQFYWDITRVWWLSIDIESVGTNQH